MGGATARGAEKDKCTLMSIRNGFALVSLLSLSVASAAGSHPSTQKIPAGSLRLVCAFKNASRASNAFPGFAGFGLDLKDKRLWAMSSASEGVAFTKVNVTPMRCLGCFRIQADFGSESWSFETAENGSGIVGFKTISGVPVKSSKIQSTCLRRAY